ncbi:MAG: flagellar basal body-associated protein FliL [Proteobacteria bacterium]|nr:flagellar basal body-associated protein FliL [Pseudomonadota bacterium]
MRKSVGAFLGALLLMGCLAGQAEEKEGKGAAAQYVPLESVLVNLAGRRHYLRADIQLLVANGEEAEKVREHMPAIRHSLIMLLSGRDPEQVSTVQEREKLRQEAKGEIRKVLQGFHAGEGLKDLFFTDFMVQ